MARKRMNYETVSARFPEGTFARITNVVKRGELKADFIRSAVEAKLAARERHRQPLPTEDVSEPST